VVFSVIFDNNEDSNNNLSINFIDTVIEELKKC
jgi:hypothetical protein